MNKNSSVASVVEKFIIDFIESINNVSELKSEPLILNNPSPEKYELSELIDHTLLRPDATYSEIHTLCEEAIEYNFKSVCVNSSQISLVAKLLHGKKPIPIAVVGFPLGASLSSVKAFEASQSILNGAREIDMVINIGALKSKDYKFVYEDINTVVNSAKNIPVKVILETSLLSKEEIIAASAIAKAANASFVKTSTGFSKGGATEEDVSMMRTVVGSEMGVKASGGVRSKEDALKMISSGATRLGTSCSVAIVTGKGSPSNY